MLPLNNKHKAKMISFKVRLMDVVYSLTATSSGLQDPYRASTYERMVISSTSPDHCTLLLGRIGILLRMYLLCAACVPSPLGVRVKSGGGVDCQMSLWRCAQFISVPPNCL